MNMKRSCPLFALPTGIRPSDFYWEPVSNLPKRPKKKPLVPFTEAEKLAYKAHHRLKILQRWKEKWDRQETEYLRRRAKALEASVAADKEWLRIENEREERRMQAEAELKAVQHYYRSEREKELAAQDKARRDKAAKLLKEINADACKSERDLLASRGAIRGRRYPNRPPNAGTS
jgi:hypothetical protein